MYAIRSYYAFYGQGMNASFEDIVEFDSILNMHPDPNSKNDWETIFKAYENTRKKDTDAIADFVITSYSIHYTKLYETQISVTYAKHLESKILKALFNTHSYEEVAYEITTLENKNQHIGIGMVGELKEPMEETAFLNYVKAKMNLTHIRHTNLLNKPIKRVAVLGGSGSFAIEAAKSHGRNNFV